MYALVTGASAGIGKEIAKYLYILNLPFSNLKVYFNVSALSSYSFLEIILRLPILMKRKSTA